MKKRIQFQWTGIFLLFVLIAAAAHPSHVHADDGIPPPTEPSSTESSPTPEPSDESGVTEADQSLPTGETSILEQLPEDTRLVVTTSDGEVLPLATQQAAEIAAHGDPIWCPEGVAPQAGAGGCTDPGLGNANYDPTSLASLLAYLAANQPTQHGVIWIEASYNSSVNDPAATGFTLDGSSLTTWRNYNLTLQGGWNGVSGSSSVVGVSLFSGDYLEIINWQADVTINEVTVDGTTGNHGIAITTSGNVALDNVQAQNSDLSGAYIDNTAGTGNVTISGTNNFSNNDNMGLLIYSKGNVSANNITANNNAIESGMYVNNTFGTGNVTLTGTNTFNNNNNKGLDIRTQGTVTLNNITANNSVNSNGLYVDNKFSTSGASVTLNGTNLFSGNRGTNLAIFSKGSITLNNVTANDSLFGDGAYIDSFTASDGTPVTLNGVNVFNNNKLNGIYVVAEGPITLNNTTADGNDGTGVFLANNAGAGNVSVNASHLTGNGSTGLRIFTNGDATINCSSFTNNTGYGNHSTLPGTLFLNSNTFVGNTSGSYLVDGGGTASVDDAYPCSSGGSGGGGGTSDPGGFPPVSGGQGTTLDCTVSNRFRLTLPNNDNMTFLCPISGKATLVPVVENLPGPLPEGAALLSGMDGRINNIPTAVQSGHIIVSFAIPQGTDVSSLAILYWNGASWVDLAEASFSDGRSVVDPPHDNGEGFFESTVNFTGTFLLVTK